MKMITLTLLRDKQAYYIKKTFPPT